MRSRAVCSPHAAVTPPSRSCTQLLTAPTSPYTTPPHSSNVAVTQPSRICTPHSRSPHAAARPCAAPAPHVSRPFLLLQTVWGGGGAGAGGVGRRAGWGRGRRAGWDRVGGRTAGAGGGPVDRNVCTARKGVRVC